MLYNQEGDYRSRPGLLHAPQRQSVEEAILKTCNTVTTEIIFSTFEWTASTENQYIYKDRALKIIHTSRKLMSPEAKRDKVAKIVRVVYVHQQLLR